jgi:CheY-like chemotaxis protein
MAINILIADDHDDNRELLQLLLTGAGYEVRQAKDGRECLALAREEPPDLLLMDLSMPEMDGWTTIRELQIDARTQTLPCIAVTANVGLDRQQALENGFSAYVSKPFTGDDLLETISAVLANRTSLKEYAAARDTEAI